MDAVLELTLAHLGDLMLKDLLVRFQLAVMDFDPLELLGEPLILLSLRQNLSVEDLSVLS